MPISKLLSWIFIFFCNLYLHSSLSYGTNINDTIPNNILMYHRFGEIKYPSTNITAEQLRSHLEYLRDEEYKFIQVKDLLFPENTKSKTISITVDDAYLSFYEVGLPIFENYNIPVTLFLNTENVGGDNYMNWDQLRDVLNRGVDIQNHTHTHSSLPKLSEEKIKEEIEKSQKIINKNLNISPNLFAYPFGEASAKVQNIVAQYFDAAFGQHSGAFSIDQRYYIPRFPLNENYSSIERIRDASKALPFENIFLSPKDAYLNPSSKRFVLEVPGGTKGINCYIRDFQGSFEKKITNLQNKLLIELNRLPVSGRLRFNCTKIESEIYWFGYQYLIN
tara:strand:- start:68 stop:1069 length:1002 start_codon:yes stop_codon:yes gene_type:complete